MISNIVLGGDESEMYTWAFEVLRDFAAIQR